MGLNKNILDLMNSPDPSNVNLAYHLITSQGLGLEKYFRAWIDERFQFLKEKIEEGVLKFDVLKCGFKVSISGEEYDKLNKELLKRQIFIFHPYFVLKGFFHKDIRFKLHKNRDKLLQLISHPKHYSIVRIKIPKYIYETVDKKNGLRR